MDISTLTDSELAENLNAILTEQQRRATLASIPAQITDLSTRYKDGGGDVAALRTALDA